MALQRRMPGVGMGDMSAGMGALSQPQPRPQSSEPGAPPAPMQAQPLAPAAPPVMGMPGMGMGMGMGTAGGMLPGQPAQGDPWTDQTLRPPRPPMPPGVAQPPMAPMGAAPVPQGVMGDPWTDILSRLSLGGAR